MARTRAEIALAPRSGFPTDVLLALSAVEPVADRVLVATNGSSGTAGDQSFDYVEPLTRALLP
jgi:hypothetical protein